MVSSDFFAEKNILVAPFFSVAPVSRLWCLDLNEILSQDSGINKKHIGSSFHPTKIRCNEVHFSFLDTPPKTNMSPKKGLSNHWFSGDMLVFRGVALNSTWRQNLCGEDHRKSESWRRSAVPRCEGIRAPELTQAQKGGTRQTAVVKTGRFYNSQGTDF